MAGSGASVAVGPFSGGLNQLEDPRLIADNQAQVINNLDIGRTGELISRVGLKRIRGGIGGLTNNLVLIGTAVGSNGVYYVFAKDTSTGYIWYTNGAATGGVVGPNATWTQMTSTSTQLYYGNKVVQYGNTLVFVPKIGTSWAGFTATIGSGGITGVTANTSMPTGNNAFIHKDRLFIFGVADSTVATASPSQRVYYSAATNVTSFPGTNFFDIGAGDGEGVNAYGIQNDTVVFFKTRSTYVLTFDTDPGLGILRRVSSSIGAASAQAVVPYETVLYVLTATTVYRVQNLLFTEIGRNLNLPVERLELPSEIDTTKQDWVFVNGVRIIFAVYAAGISVYSYFVYDTEIQAWARYTFGEQPNRFFSVFDGPTGNLKEQFIASKNASPNLYYFNPYNTGNSNYGDYPTDSVPYSVVSKKLNYGDPSLYKRLFWWGLDLLTNNAVSLTFFSDGVQGPISTLGGSSLVKFYRMYASARARYFEFSVYASGVNQKLVIYPGLVRIAQKVNVDDAITT